MTNPSAPKFRIERLAHFHLNEVPEYYINTPEKAVGVIVLDYDASEHWEEHWASHCGKLLAIVPLVAEVPAFDGRTAAVECLQAELTTFRANSQAHINKLQGKIADLLALPDSTSGTSDTFDTSTPF